MGIWRDRPTPHVDNMLDAAEGRNGRYGERYVLPVLGGHGTHVAADEGSYFTAITPTPGTGIIGAAVTTFVETTPILVLYNGHSSNRIILDFLRLIKTVVEVTSTRVQHTFVVDDGNRYSSGGTALTINNSNMDSLNSSGASGYVGAITASAASANRRVLGHVVSRGATVGVVHDVLQFNFGHGSTHAQGYATTTSVSQFIFNMPPVVLGPDQSFVLYDWAAAMATAPTWAVEFGFVSR